MFESRPILQSKLRGVLVRELFYPIALVGDLRKAFLYVRVKEEGRNAFRFHWLRDISSTNVQTLRFTGLYLGWLFLPSFYNQPSSYIWKDAVTVFQLAWPKFYLVFTWMTWLNHCIRDLEAELKSEAITIFAEGCFTLHKWHSNVPELETDKAETVDSDVGISYAKQQLGVTAGDGCKLTGLPWNKM